MSYLKTGAIAATTTVVGSGLIWGLPYLVRTARGADAAYRAAAQKTRNAPVIQFDVPGDGSVDFSKEAKAEVGDGFFARQAYESIVRKEMKESLGPGWEHDHGENVLWTGKKEPVYDPITQTYADVPGRISMMGDMPCGRTVPVRDYDGNGRFGNQPSKNQIKAMQRSDFRNVMSQQRR